MNKSIIVACMFLVMTGVSKAGEIHDAVENNNIEKVQVLLKANPDLANARDAEGSTPLHYVANIMTVTVSLDSNAKGTASTTAPKDPMMEMALLLISKGADVNAKTKIGTTPLLGVVRGNNLPLAKLLIDKGAKTDVVMPSGGDKSCTLLHFAAFHDNAKLVKLLFFHKAPLNAKTDSGFTPLHTAASLNSVSAGKALLDAGADVNAKDGKGRTPLNVATEEKNQKMIDLLKKHGAK